MNDSKERINKSIKNKFQKFGTLKYKDKKKMDGNSTAEKQADNDGSHTQMIIENIPCSPYANRNFERSNYQRKVISPEPMSYGKVSPTLIELFRL